MTIDFEWIDGNFGATNDQLVKECSQLYSTQYGRWSVHSPINAGKSIKLSPQRIREWLSNDDVAIYLARDKDVVNEDTGNAMLVGYAIAMDLDVPKYGLISWVTQLVVHENYRHQNVAKELLSSIWAFTDNFAWGIISANPYAVRALEKTTRRRSDPTRIKRNLRKIISLGVQNLPYINKNTEVFVSNEVSRINTEFYVDHSDVGRMIETVVTDTVPWRLGELEEGWEWLAFTFQDQLPFELSQKEIENILVNSDNVVQEAYRRMNLSDKHGWMANTKNEVDFIYKECGLNHGDALLDFGCGQGRHSIELAQRGISVIGIDYVDGNIKIAQQKKDELGLRELEFIVGDCRYVRLNKKAPAAICLYDVIGTYTDNKENIKILQNIADHLEIGGIALISVMNYEVTIAQAKHTFVFREDPNKLLTLKPSNIMESTGDVFKPDYYLVDIETGVVYRREQFKRGNKRIEPIVRDKRFKRTEIEEMCRSVGFHIEYSRFVNARNWEIGLDSTHQSSKEILLKCRKVME